MYQFTMYWYYCVHCIFINFFINIVLKCGHLHFNSEEANAWKCELNCMTPHSWKTYISRQPRLPHLLLEEHRLEISHTRKSMECIKLRFFKVDQNGYSSMSNCRLPQKVITIWERRT